MSVDERLVELGATTATSSRSRRGWRRIGALLGVAILCLAVVASLRFGSVSIDWGTVVHAFTSPTRTNDSIIVRDIRLPRTLLGIGVGASLAIAGALMQAVTRNPLADPGILGINAGASLSVIISIFLLHVTAVSRYAWFGLAGAALTALLVYSLGSAGRGGLTPAKVTLAGAVVAALLTSVTSSIMVLDQRSLDQYRFWVVGSIAGRGMTVVEAVAPFMAAGLAVAIASGRAVNVLVLGDEVARSLGQRVGRVRALAAGAIVLLAGSSVAAAGPIAFLGLAVPHMVRVVTGADYRWIIAYCALYGPALLLFADIAGRLVVRPGELQVGIAMAVVGAPLFVYLARRRKLAAT